MSYLLAWPEAMATAVADLGALGASIGAATATAAGATTGMLAAAADEVSEAIAALFDGHGRQFQALAGQVEAFRADFSAALSATGEAYAGAEATNTVTLIMAGSGTPTPSPTFIDNIVRTYLGSDFPTGIVKGLTLLSQEYPTSGVNDLTQDVSIARGVTILNNSIRDELAAGHAVNVVGYSQSANIASLVMQQLNPTGTPSSLPINFVLLGNSMNPNGGWDARFPGLSFPSIGFTTLGAAPANSFPTTVYTLEYDGWADFPRYPINILSDLNALVGMVTVHGGYETLTPAQLDSAILLPTEGATTTDYYMIPTPNLPLLEPVRFLPFIGDPIADLLDPVLRPIVNWGYGDPNYGWSTGPANVPTSFGLLPPLDTTLAVGPAIANGIPGGIAAALNHIQNPEPSSFLFSGPDTWALPGTGTQLVDGAMTAFSALRPTADIATAALISLPAYDVQLFLDGVSQMMNGQPVTGLINALGNPIAANAGLLPFLGALEVAVLAQTAESVVTGTPY